MKNRYIQKKPASLMNNNSMKTTKKANKKINKMEIKMPEAEM